MRSAWIALLALATAACVDDGDAIAVDDVALVAACEPGLLRCGDACCTAVDISAGALNTCAVTSAGTVQCWGDNELGQVGNGTASRDRVNHPVDVVGLHDAVAVRVGHASCALRADHTVHCWGPNDRGQLGNGSRVDFSPTPVAVTGLRDAVALSVGASHACAVRASGSVVCWGNNEWGQLGNGYISPSRVPVVARGIDAVDVDAGYQSTCAVTRAGTVSCWGRNDSGQLGIGTTVNRSFPTPVPGLSGIAKVVVGNRHACALQSGMTYCWGWNYYGQLGAGSGYTLTPVLTTLGFGFASLTAGYEHTCAPSPASPYGGGFCWGKNTYGQLGIGDYEHAFPTVIGTGQPYRVVDAGLDHTCGITLDGRAQCWGESTFGQIGDDQNTYWPPRPQLVRSD